MGIYVTKDQYCQACSTDLYNFLVQWHGSKITLQYGSALLLADHHVSVKKGYKGYSNFRTGEKGNNVDYLMNYLGYDYPSAVLALTEGCSTTSTHVQMDNIHISDTKEINLPARLNGPYKNLYAFLIERNIPADVIQLLVDKGIIYQSAEGNNIVFVNPQMDYCEIRGTNSYADRRCRKRNDCDMYSVGEHTWCDYMGSCAAYKASPFHGCRKAIPDRFWYLEPNPEKRSDIIYICESAIDAISLYVIHERQGKEKSKSVYVSIGGVANQKAIDRIIRHRNQSTVILAVDNDIAGQECRDRNHELNYILPCNKDWNEDLQKGDY